MSNLTKYEQETIINYNEEEKTASVYTHNRALIKRLDELSRTSPDDCRRIKATANYGDYIVPKKWVTVKPQRRVNMSEEQKAAFKERMKTTNTQVKATAQRRMRFEVWKRHEEWSANT